MAPPHPEIPKVPPSPRVQNGFVLFIDMWTLTSASFFALAVIHELQCTVYMYGQLCI